MRAPVRRHAVCIGCCVRLYIKDTKSFSGEQTEEQVLSIIHCREPRNVKKRYSKFIIICHTQCYVCVLDRARNVWEKVKI